ncbi:hypothetical protein F511_25086 [Dorcoceras hygrometricum]|uniref:Uncharacterized protein n=1 Tax=Dorcoceras hygrometricum TaxID=472368 RepID=A0A2Z7AMX3_9LAMI|nr:hypothetical protein F511_25086 [Dorcoceras hygrometricum]
MICSEDNRRLAYGHLNVSGWATVSCRIMGVWMSAGTIQHSTDQEFFPHILLQDELHQESRGRRDSALEEASSDNGERVLAGIAQLLERLVGQASQRGSLVGWGSNQGDPQEQFRHQCQKDFLGTTDPLVAESSTICSSKIRTNRVHWTEETGRSSWNSEGTPKLVEQRTFKLERRGDARAGPTWDAMQVLQESRAQEASSWFTNLTSFMKQKSIGQAQIKCSVQEKCSSANPYTRAEQPVPEVEDQPRNSPAHTNSSWGSRPSGVYLSMHNDKSDSMRFYPESNSSSSERPTFSGSLPVHGEDHVNNLGPNPISEANNTDHQDLSPSNLQMVVYNVHREENTRISYEEDVDSSHADSKVISLDSKVISLDSKVHSMNSRVSLDSLVEELLNIQTFMKHDFKTYKRGFYDKMDTVAANVTSSQTSLETSLVHQLTEHQLQLASDLDFVKLQLEELFNHLKEIGDAKKRKGGQCSGFGGSRGPSSKGPGPSSKRGEGTSSSKKRK